MRSDPVTSTSALLTHYSFDLGNNTVDHLVGKWLADYPAKWVIAAVIESIYQGRFKVSSVDNILLKWYRDGRPQHHFDLEFADLICGKLLKKGSAQPVVSIDTSEVPQTSRRMIQEPFAAKLPVINPPKDEAEDWSEEESAAYSSKVPNQGIGKWLKLVTKL
jgi:hypothetical protein